MSGDIAQLGFQVDSQPLANANTQLERMPASAQKASSATDKFNASLSNTTKASQKFYTTLETMAEKAGAVIGDNLRQIALGFGALFAVNEFVNKLTETAHELDEVSKAARATGSSVASMQALATAGNLAGLGADYIAAATKRMNKVLGEAIAQGKSTSGVFQELGVSAKTLAALPVDQRFAMIGDRIQSLGLNSAQAAALLVKLGDRGGQLINMFADGGNEIRKAAEEVKTFGLALTDVQGKNIEDMEDNFKRLGFSIQGAFNQFIADVAPTLSVIFAGMANGILFIRNNFTALAPAIEIVSAMLAVAFTPAVVGIIIDMAVAVGTNLLGAMTALSVAMDANPLGLFVVLIAGAVTAIWAFRDQIKATIGIDVQQIFKDAVNFIIRAFMGALEQIKYLWGGLPGIIGSVAIGATNAVINALNSMIGAAVTGINNLIGLVQNIPGVSNMLKQLDTSTGQIGTITDSFAAGNAVKAQITATNQAIIAQTDYVGNFTTAWTNATAATTASATGIGNVGNVASDTTPKIAKLTQAQKDAAKASKEFSDAIKDGLGSALRTFFGDLKDGKSLLDSFGDALNSIADKALDMLSSGIINNLFSAFAGGLGGSMTSFTGLSGMSGSLMNAKGNVFGGSGVVSSPTMFKFAQGTGMMGEAGPEAIMPLQRGSNGALGVAMVSGSAANQNSGGMGSVIVNIYNSTANDNDVSVSQGAGGSIDVMIDKKMADNINNRGSRSHKAIRTTFGINAAVKPRN